MAGRFASFRLTRRALKTMGAVPVFVKLRPHDLRRIFATNAVNGGLPVHTAAKLLGHLDINTTQAYVPCTTTRSSATCKPA